MLLKLAALGALGYAGYKYYQKNGATLFQTGSGRIDEPDLDDPRVAMAGGPLGEQATVVESGQSFPGA